MSCDVGAGGGAGPELSSYFAEAAAGAITPSVSASASVVLIGWVREIAAMRRAAQGGLDRPVERRGTHVHSFGRDRPVRSMRR
jgi:hypothetical protein